jgi:hypothetical protein
MILCDTFPRGHLNQAVTCIKRSPFCWPVIEHFIWIEHLLRGHLTYKATIHLSKGCPFNTGLTGIYNIYISSTWTLRYVWTSDKF